VRGFGRHHQARLAKHPAANTVVDTTPEPGEDGTSHVPQLLATNSDTQITDGLAQIDKIVGDPTDFDAEGSGGSIEAGGTMSGKCQSQI